MKKEKIYPFSPRIKDDLKRVEEALNEVVFSENRRLAKTSLTTLQAGGKRIRPALVLISGMAGEYNLEKLIPASLAVELIHMASLVHDDVVDGASTRRGFPTVNSVWGFETATATGDFLFSTAFVYLSQLRNPRIIEIMADASLALSLGELEQMETVFRADQTIEDYLTKIRHKTATFFSACCSLGGLVSQTDEKDIEALGMYGENLGMVFQIYDDILDLSGLEKSLGKLLGTDIKDGIMTMPIFFALEESPHREELRRIIEERASSPEDINRAIDIVCQTRALDRARQGALAYLKTALEVSQSISSESVRRNLEAVGNFVVERNC